MLPVQFPISMGAAASGNPKSEILAFRNSGGRHSSSWVRRIVTARTWSDRKCFTHATKFGTIFLTMETIYERTCQNQRRRNPRPSRLYFQPLRQGLKRHWDMEVIFCCTSERVMGRECDGLDYDYIIGLFLGKHR